MNTRMLEIGRGITALLVLSMVATGCGNDKTSAEPTRSRFDAVNAKPKNDMWGDFCDVHGAKAAQLAPFQFPALASGQPAAGANAWRWINVWATWCKPCIEELGLISKWRKNFGEQSKLGVEFLSVDSDANAVSNFAMQHPEVNRTLRVQDLATFAAWIGALGLPQDTSIPLQVFVNPQRRVECVRAGAVDDSHQDIISKVFELAN